MEKEKLEKELEEIDEKMKLKEIEIKNSSEYKLLETTKEELYSKQSDKERELRKLKKEIYLKYVTRLDGRMFGVGFRTGNIKSSVKQGIKAGLGIPNVSLVDNYGWKRIVNQLIDKDLEKIKKQTDKLQSEITDTYTKLKRCYDSEEKLMGGLNALEKQRKKISNKLNAKKYLKEKGMKKWRKEVDKFLKDGSPEVMDKIGEEINRRLILENLED